MCFKEVRQGHRFKDVFPLPSTSPWPNTPQKLISWGQLFFYKYSCCMVTILQWKSGCLLPAVLNSALLKELGERCGCMIYPALLPAGCVRCMSATECLGCLGQAPSWDEVSMAENSATTHAEGCACTFPALSTVDGYIKISACVLPSYYCLPNCSGDVHCVEFHRSNYP